MKKINKSLVYLLFLHLHSVAETNNKFSVYC